MFLSPFQVLFRYAIAIFKYTEDSLLKQNDYMSIVNTLRDRLESLTDIETLTQVGHCQTFIHSFIDTFIHSLMQEHQKHSEGQARVTDWHWNSHSGRTLSCNHSFIHSLKHEHCKHSEVKLKSLTDIETLTQVGHCLSFIHSFIFSFIHSLMHKHC